MLIKDFREHQQQPNDHQLLRYSKQQQRMTYLRLHNLSLPWIILFFLFCLKCDVSFAQQQQDPTTLNGGSILAMAGKECVAIAVDKRFGSGMQMVTITPRHVLIPNSQVVVAFTGLEGDIQSLSQELSTQITSKVGRSSSRMFFGVPSSSSSNGISPRALASLTSHVLYNRRQAPYYVEPMVVGISKLNQVKRGISSTMDDKIAPSSSSSQYTSSNDQDDHYEPYLCAMDMIGAKSQSHAFVCGGVASKSIYGTAEALWKPNLEPNELLQVCSRAFSSALERDCLSGYGIVVYLITPKDGIVEYDIATRND